MRYVCKIVGGLKLDELNLTLSYMELIDFHSDDFKISYKLRQAFKRNEIEIYDPKVHKCVHKLSSKTYEEPKINIPPISQQKIISNNDNIILDKLDKIIEKLSNLSIPNLNLSDLINTIQSSRIYKEESNTLQKRDDSIPVYVPKTDTNSILEAKIITKEEKSDSTKSILTKLKELKQ